MPKHNKTTEEKNKNGKSRVAEVYPVPSGGGGGLFLPAVAVMSVKLLYGLERGVVENGWRRGRPTPLIYLHLQSPPCVVFVFLFPHPLTCLFRCRVYHTPSAPATIVSQGNELCSDLIPRSSRIAPLPRLSLRMCYAVMASA